MKAFHKAAASCVVGTAVVGTTLALAWFDLAQRRGNRDTTRKMLEERLTYVQLAPEIADKIRPMLDIGSYLGTGR